MNRDHERELEAAVHRMLSGLPELQAPASLSRRVMAALERRESTPWYRLPWQAWRLELRVVSLAMLLCGFAGLWFGGWELMRAPGVETATTDIGRVFSWLGLVWNTLVVLSGAAQVVLKHFGTAAILAGVALIGFAYAACLGLGTVCLRLAPVRR